MARARIAQTAFQFIEVDGSLVNLANVTKITPRQTGPTTMSIHVWYAGGEEAPDIFRIPSDEFSDLLKILRKETTLE